MGKGNYGTVYPTINLRTELTAFICRFLTIQDGLYITRFHKVFLRRKIDRWFCFKLTSEPNSVSSGTGFIHILGSKLQEFLQTFFQNNNFFFKTQRLSHRWSIETLKNPGTSKNTVQWNMHLSLVIILGLLYSEDRQIRTKFLRTS